MTSNARDAEAERLAAEQRHGRLRRFLEDEIWPQIPDALRRKKITKEERAELLGYGPDGG
jgi:antitoxin VapB